MQGPVWIRRAEPDEYRFVPRVLYRELERTGRPPGGTQLWLGAHPKDYNVRFVGYRITLKALDDGPGFILGLTFGHGVLQLMHHGQIDAEYRLSLAPRARLSQIWPASDTVAWPNRLRVFDPRIELLEHEIAQEFNGFRTPRP